MMALEFEATRRPGASPQRPVPTLGILDAEAQAYVASGLRELLPIGLGVEPRLRGVIEDVLGCPGSLIRAQLAFAILRQYDVARETSRELAIAIEYFHSASLVFDDLPSMDDASERRGRTCPHLVFGEAAATLGALALITRAYELLWRVVGALPEDRRQQASKLVSESLGLSGILNGQAMDLAFSSTAGGAPDVEAVAQGKTVPLIRLALVLPALVGGASVEVLGHFERLAELWGLAYQATDDFKDGLMTGGETGKSTARDVELNRPNLAATLGRTGALESLTRLLTQARQTLDGLPCNEGEHCPLEQLQNRLEEEMLEIRDRIFRSKCA